MNPRGYSAIGLHHPKDRHNIGGVLRACGVYDASMLVTTGKRYSRHAADTISTWKHMPFFQNVDDLKSYVPYDCVPVAVDIVPDAVSLVEYVHPERAFYIFGPEDSTLGKDIISWCRDVIYIPGNHCMNLAMSVSTVLYDRMAKQTRRVADTNSIRTQQKEIQIGFHTHDPS